MAQIPVLTFVFNLNTDQSVEVIAPVDEIGGIGEGSVGDFSYDTNFSVFENFGPRPHNPFEQPFYSFGTSSSPVEARADLPDPRFSQFVHEFAMGVNLRNYSLVPNTVEVSWLANYVLNAQGNYSSASLAASAFYGPNTTPLFAGSVVNDSFIFGDPHDMFVVSLPAAQIVDGDKIPSSTILGVGIGAQAQASVVPEPPILCFVLTGVAGAVGFLSKNRA
jgi:hypothetical protein